MRINPSGRRQATCTFFGWIERQLGRVSGTGKWEGIIITGHTVEPLCPFPAIKEGTFQDCNHQTGTTKLK
jgi:hypothetical protein